jgi:hypothetical protein
VLGGLGPLADVDLHFGWPELNLRIVAQFDDLSVAGGRRRVGPDEVPAFATPYDFQPN